MDEIGKNFLGSTVVPPMAEGCQDDGERITVRWKVVGIVQGVGFRPFCARLAGALGLGGEVKNTPEGVEIELRGTWEATETFIRRLRQELPPLARLDGLWKETVMPLEGASLGPFLIRESLAVGDSCVLLPPDVATCAECLRELRDPEDRRFRYPFTNCTHCGPRFSIVEMLPYDRPRTTMKKFTLCPQCLQEYETPLDRRFHAQPVACPVCGPELRLTDRTGALLARGDAAMDRAGEALIQGRILAVKGLGGYHLACDASREASVADLRRRKNRPDRPFALMVRDLEVAETLVFLRPTDRELLSSAQAPILLAPRRTPGLLAPSVAPRQGDLGIMLPYTPLHHLLMDFLPCCVLTSANASGDALVADDDEARTVLDGMADLWLAHDRPIRCRMDDSVCRTWAEGHIFIRRSRGYAPSPLRSFKPLPSLCAAGAEMKAVFALTRRSDVFLSPYLGHLRHLSAARSYREMLEHFRVLFSLSPNCLVQDLHPQYLSTVLAREVVAPERTIAVQHHHAHFAAVLWEHRWEDSALGVILDGTGYGEDGTIWGGEFFLGSQRQVRRVGSLRPIPLLGGDRATEEPWRSGIALACEALGHVEGQLWAQELWPHGGNTLDRLGKLGAFCPKTSSCGRLLDGFSALMRGPEVVSYDGQGPMEMEGWLHGSRASARAPFLLEQGEDFWYLDWRPAVRWLREQSTAGFPRPELAWGLLEGFAFGVVRLVETLSENRRDMPVALSGGVWQNRFLLNRVTAALRQRGFLVMAHREVSPNDEGLALGQIAVAVAQMA